MSSVNDFVVFVAEVVLIFSSRLTDSRSSVKELGGVVVSAVLLSGLLKPSPNRWAKNKITHRGPLPRTITCKLFVITVCNKFDPIQSEKYWPNKMCRKRSSTGFWQILPTLPALLALTTAAHLTLRPTQGFWVCFMGSVCYRFGVMCSKSTTSFEIPLIWYFRIQNIYTSLGLRNIQILIYKLNERNYFYTCW